MVIRVNTEEFIDWVENVVDDLTEYLCDAFPELSREGVMYELYAAYSEMTIRGEPMGFEEVIRRGIDGGERGPPRTNWAGCDWGSDLLEQLRQENEEREAVRQYAALTSPQLTERLRDLAWRDGDCQLQVLELHRALKLPPESDRWLQVMFPGGHSMASLEEVEESIHLYGHCTDIPF